MHRRNGVRIVDVYDNGETMIPIERFWSVWALVRHHTWPHTLLLTGGQAMAVGTHWNGGKPENDNAR